MRTEKIIARPFFRIPSMLESLWAKCGIRFSENRDFTDSEAIIVSTPIHEACLELSLPTDLLDCLSDLDSIHEWSLSVVLTDETRRKSAELYRLKLDDLGDEVVKVPHRNHGLSWGGKHGAKVSAYLWQDRDRVPEPGVPHRYGHIVAMKHWNLNRHSHGAEFSVNFYTPQQFEEAGFAKSTAAVFKGDADALLDPEGDSAMLEIWVSEHLRAVFGSDATSAEAVRTAIKSQLVAQVLTILRPHSAELDEEPDEGRSLGKRFVKRTLKSRAKALGTADEATIVSWAQEFVGMTESCAKVVKS